MRSSDHRIGSCHPTGPRLPTVVGSSPGLQPHVSSRTLCGRAHSSANRRLTGHRGARVHPPGSVCATAARLVRFSAAAAARPLSTDRGGEAARAARRQQGPRGVRGPGAPGDPGDPGTVGREDGAGPGLRPLGRSAGRSGYLAGVRDLLPGRRGPHPETPGTRGKAQRRRAAAPAQQPAEGHCRRHLAG